MEKTLQARGREGEKKKIPLTPLSPLGMAAATLRTKAEWETPPSAPLSSRPWWDRRLRVLRSIATMICDRISGLRSCEVVGGLKPEASS
jgi:hypothetical protein